MLGKAFISKSMIDHASSPEIGSSEVSSPELEQLLFRLGRALRKITYPHCSKEASSIDGAGYWQLAILHEHGPLRPSDLANILSLDISTVSRQLKQLEANGLVTRKVHEQDARAYLIIITQTGERVLDEIIRLRQQTIDGVVEQWPKGEVQMLLKLVEKLTFGIEKQAVPRAKANPN
ncbi:MAG: MarR family transcriptional regulator [Actinomycetota bacterium]|nr:MAG: MarR family transcriptional regulator [Actinomycetota bacterium]